MKILVIQADKRLLLPEEAGSPRPFYHCKGLSQGHELHYVTISSISAEEFDRFGADERVRQLFRTTGRIHNPAYAPAWRRGVNFLLGRPFFDRSFKQPGFVDGARQEVAALVDRHGADRVLCFGLESVQYSPPALWPRTVAFVADLVSVGYRRRARLLGRQRRWKDWLIRRACAWTAGRYERKVFPAVGAVVFNSSYDASLARRRAPRAHIRVVPNGCDLEFFSPEAVPDVPVIANLICFLGAMGYDPNADAAIHFARDILPGVRREIPDARFVAVGGDPPAELRACHDGESVRVTGYVDDVRGYLKSAAVVVSPLRHGVGMKNKLLIGLAMRKPMVVSTVTCEGFEDVVDGEHVLVADDPERFSRCVVELLTDAERAERLASAGSGLIRSRYTWPASTRGLEEILRELPRPGTPAAATG